VQGRPTLEVEASFNSVINFGPVPRELPAHTGRAPASARGTRTRTALVDGARVVFERDGFVAARITDITAQAGVATGSF
jgi:hypothetical protein